MRTLRFKTQLLSFASATALAIAATPAMAQDADTEDEVEEIVVTGIRASIISSIAKKRNNSSIVEAVSAEDIGKLPDASIAEAIARLPGISAQRLDGRANVISIRGLGPDYNTALLNGREQVTSNNNRGVEFDQYPSELMSGVTIYKSPDAGLMAQAIGGTVDMQTLRPLAHGEQTLAVGIRGEYNDLGALNAGSSAVGYRGSFSYIDQFVDDTIGVAIGYARMTSPTQEERWQAWGYPNLDYDGSNPLVLGGAKPFVKSNKLTRDGIMGVFEYQPDENLHSTLDVYYSHFNDTQQLRGIEIPGQWGAGWGNSGITSLTTGGGLVTSGVINDAAVVMRNDVSERKADTYSFGWNTEYRINDKWLVEADLAYSKVNRTMKAMESYSGTGRGNGNGAVDQLGFSMTGDGGATFSPTLDYSDASLFLLGGAFSWGDPIGPNSQDGFINKPVIKDELSAIRLSAEREMSGIFSSIEVGARYAERKKSLKDQGFYLTLKDYPAMVPVPAEYLLEPTSLAFIGMGNMLSYDSLAFYNDGNYIETDAVSVDINRTTNSWKMTEKVFTGYAQVNIDADLEGTPVTGNIGIQAVHTDQQSDGFTADTSTDPITIHPVSDGDKYWDFLPSLNLSFELANDQYLRVAASRVMARAPMDKMRASRGVNFDPSKIAFTDPTKSSWSGWGGNPQLRPYFAWSFDLSYEKYFGEGGYVSVAAYYKKLDGFHYDEGIIRDFAGVPHQGVLEPATTLGSVWSPQNGEGGHISGTEWTVSLPGSLFSEYLDGFGAIVSASFTDSEVKPVVDGDAIPIPGLSKTVINSTLYYEKHGFQARISSRHRTQFLGEVSGLSLANDATWIKGETVYDAQVGYDLSEMGVDGMSIQFQVNNLTNQSFSTTYDKEGSQIRDFQNYGRTFMLGLNWKM